MTVQQPQQHLQHQTLDVQQQQPRDEPVDEPLDEARAKIACALALLEYLTRGIEAALAVHARVLAALGAALGTALGPAAPPKRRLGTTRPLRRMPSPSPSASRLKSMSNGVIGSSERSKMSSVPRRPERLAPPAGPEALGTALRPGQASLATALGVAGSAACGLT
jgi:hypothetical protein